MSLIKLKNNALDNLTSFEGSASLGDMNLISSSDISSGTSSVEFDLGDKKQYKFFLINIHPSTDQPTFQFNFSTDSGSTYSVTKTSTYFRAHHNETDTETILGYDTSLDLAQSTSNQIITSAVGGDNDQCMNGILDVFNPSSTTFVKHYMGHSAIAEGSNFMRDDYYGGYANTTSALTNIKFLMSTGNIDDGKIIMFGLD